ncbi:lactonase family protein [Haloferula sp.]|uniref:lactonase family protein n=1 Tax=Haloferula sp. TaxID=2497595 RepID=UPI00329FD8E0
MRKILILFPLLLSGSVFAEAEWLVIGNDTKIECRAEGLTKVKPGDDTVSFINLAEGKDRPSDFPSISMTNSIFGPPTNVAVTPDQKLAIVANSMNWVEDGGVWNAEPAKTLYVIDLEGGKPGAVSAVKTKAQPSGMSISRDGKNLLVANRADRSVSLFRIEDKSARLLDTVSVDGEAAAVSIHPDGKSALVAKFGEHFVGQIGVEGDKLNYDQAKDIPVGLSPYNVKIHPGGEFAIVCNTGNRGLPDGHRDTLSLIDLGAEGAHVYDTIPVGDGPEGLAISADGKYVAVPLLNGSTDMFKDKWFHHPNGEVVLYQADGKELKEVSRVETGAFPEGIAFSADASHLYVANLDSEDLSVYAIDDGKLRQLGEPISLPGKPGSMGSAH